jgi:large subunit ribosomal protein L6
MSRIGNKPIDLADNVSIDVTDKNLVVVKGPRGELAQQVDPDIAIKVDDGKVHVSRPTDQKRHKAMHGLYRSLIANMVEGVSKGYEKKLELVGVGYRADVQPENVLDLMLGQSHHIYFQIPPEVKVTTETLKGKNPTITLESTDKQLIGHVAAKIRSLRKVEPYKGKGVRFVGEKVRRKAGKAAAK